MNRVDTNNRHWNL